MSGLARKLAIVETDARGHGLLALIDRSLEDEGCIPGTGEPRVLEQLVLQLPGSPPGVAQKNLEPRGPWPAAMVSSMSLPTLR